MISFSTGKTAQTEKNSWTTLVKASQEVVKRKNHLLSATLSQSELAVRYRPVSKCLIVK